jgi:hypothetical protein
VEELGDQATSYTATYMRLHFMINTLLIKCSTHQI